MPANFPDHVAQTAATYAVNKAGFYMVSKDYNWFSATVRGGTFNSVFKALTMLYLNTYLGLPKNTALVNMTFVSQGLTPSVPVICE